MWYCLSCCILLVLINGISNLCFKNILQRKKLFLKISLIIFVLFFGLRGEFSSDYAGYAEWFRATANLSLKEIIFSSAVSSDLKGEFLLFAVFKVIRVFTDNVVVMQIVCGIIFTMPVFLAINNEENDDYLIAVLTFFSVGLVGTFNVMRIMISFAYLLGGVKYAKRKDLLRWSLLILACSIVHIGALFLFPVYFIVSTKNRSFKATFLYIVVLSIGVYFFKDILVRLSSYTRLFNYFQNDSYRVHAVEMGTAWIPPIILWSLYYLLTVLAKKPDPEKSNNYYRLIGYTAIVFNILQYRIALVSRYASFFNMILVLALPTAIAESRIDNRYKLLFKVTIVILLLIYSFYVCPNYYFI